MKNGILCEHLHADRHSKCMHQLYTARHQSLRPASSCRLYLCKRSTSSQQLRLLAEINHIRACNDGS